MLSSVFKVLKKKRKKIVFHLKLFPNNYSLKDLSNLTTKQKKRASLFFYSYRVSSLIFLINIFITQGGFFLALRVHHTLIERFALGASLYTAQKPTVLFVRSLPVIG